MPLGTAFCGWPLLAPALANWFSKRRGLAMAIGQVGGGVSFTYGMFIEYTISQLSWRSAYFVVAGMLVTIIVPLYLFFFQAFLKCRHQGFGLTGATNRRLRPDKPPRRMKGTFPPPA